MKKLLIVFVCLTPLIATAQGDIDELLKKSVSDGEKLIEGYISPFMKSVSLGLNQGWYNTAKPHKVAGVDLTFTASALTIPKSDLFYDVTKLSLEAVELDPSSPDYPNAPTVFGPDRAPIYHVKGSTPDDVFEAPGGIDLKGEIGKNWMPVPMVTLGFGLPKNTDIKFRFVPTIDVGDNGEVKLFGVGVMHDVKQWIPGIKLLPFDLSAFVGFTRLSLDYKYTQADVTGENQRAEFSMNATTIQGVISKKFSVLTVYGGLGYNIANSNIGLKGKWDVSGGDADGDGNIYEDEEIDPVDLKFSATGPRMTAGFRLKLAVITIHADYTLQKYKALTVGFGINVR